MKFPSVVVSEHAEFTSINPTKGRSVWPVVAGGQGQVQAAVRSDHASAFSSERAAQRPPWPPAFRAGDSDHTQKNNLKCGENLFLFNMMEGTIFLLFLLALMTGLIIKLTGENDQLQLCVSIRGFPKRTGPSDFGLLCHLELMRKGAWGVRLKGEEGIHMKIEKQKFV